MANSNTTNTGLCWDMIPIDDLYSATLSYMEVAIRSFAFPILISAGLSTLWVFIPDNRRNAGRILGFICALTFLVVVLVLGLVILGGTLSSRIVVNMICANTPEERASVAFEIIVMGGVIAIIIGAQVIGCVCRFAKRILVIDTNSTNLQGPVQNGTVTQSITSTIAPTPVTIVDHEIQLVDLEVPTPIVTVRRVAPNALTAPPMTTYAHRRQSSTHRGSHRLLPVIDESSAPTELVDFEDPDMMKQ